MTIKQYEIALMGEKIYRARLKDGLQVFLMPRTGYSKMHAMFATRYGSIDTDFITPDGKRLSIPDGTAHFLEHKLFDNKDGNVFEKFSRYGASANAYTSANTTAYHFTATENIYENLTALIEFVQNPYFTPESIQKEQGIIGQEIQIGDDDPGWQVYFNLLKGLYHNHSVRRYIAVTIVSIATFNKDVLDDGLYSFYHPSNMVLFVTGNIELDKICECIDKSLKYYGDDKGKIERIFAEEPDSVLKQYIEVEFDIALPLFMLGFKDTEEASGDGLLKKDIAMQMLFEMIFSKSGFLFKTLYEKGLINDNFTSNYMLHNSYSYTILDGESKDPKSVRDIVFEYIDSFKISKELFETAKKVIWGKYVNSFNSPENYTREYVSNFLMGADYSKFYEIYSSITLEDMQKRLAALDKTKAVLSVALPVK